MNTILFAIPVFLLTILGEAAYAWARYRHKNIYDIPDTVTSLHQGVLSQLSGLLFKVLFVGLYVSMYEHYRVTALSADNVWVWIAALLFYDFCYYWSHRLYHEVAIFWASHIVHHSSEYYNLSTALRQPSTDWLFGWLFFLPLAVVGVPPEVFIGVGLIDLLYQYWVHTEMVGKLGWFDTVFVSPSNHRVHHGKNDYCIDKNYGGIFIIWDRLFGSYQVERDDQPVVYGIRTPLHSYNPLWGVLHYYHELYLAARAASGWRAALALWIAPPGDWHDAGLPHLDTTGMQRFRSNTPPALRWYAALHYLLYVPLFMHCLAVGEQLSALSLALYVGVLILTMQSLGALLNGARHALRLEQCRCLMLGITFFALPDWFTYTAPLWLKIAVLLSAAGSALWLMQASQREQTSR